MKEFDIVSLLQLRRGECRLIQIVYTNDLRETPKRWTFKLPAGRHVAVGDLLIDVQPNGECAVAQVINDDPNCLLMMEPGIDYRWIDPAVKTPADCDALRLVDDRLRSRLAMGEAMQKAAALAEKAGMSLDAPTHPAVTGAPMGADGLLRRATRAARTAAGQGASGQELALAIGDAVWKEGVRHGSWLVEIVATAMLGAPLGERGAALDDMRARTRAWLRASPAFAEAITAADADTGWYERMRTAARDEGVQFRG